MGRTKVVITLGSPREKGNSSLLALRAADGVRESGGEPVIFKLHAMRASGTRTSGASSPTT